MWDNLKDNPNFASGVLSTEGIDIESFLAQSDIDILMALNLIVTADTIFASDTSFLQNHTFSMNLGHNEI